MVIATRQDLSSASPQIRCQSAYPGFWMRSVQFAGLHRILHLIAQFREGIRVSDLNGEICERRVYRTQHGQPSKTTLYHCRNTLLQLGAVQRSGGRLAVVRGDRHVAALLAEPPVQADALPIAACAPFSELVLRNRDCHENFFRLFLPGSKRVSLARFRSAGRPVVWSPVDDGVADTRSPQPALPPQHWAKGPRRKRYLPASLRSEDSGAGMILRAPIEIEAVLYGVRYWATKQLRLIDEFFVTGRGQVLYPVRHPEGGCRKNAVIRRILCAPDDGSGWTTLSIQELLHTSCERDGYPVSVLFDGIKEFSRTNPGCVALIATIPSFAAITATSRKRANFQLETAFRDSHGRLISHIRFHNSLRRQYHGQEQTAAAVHNRK